MASISSDAESQSAAAQPWALQYLDSDATRSRLDPSLRSLSAEALLERLEWEFSRLAILHNAPVSDQSAAEMPGLVVEL